MYDNLLHQYHRMVWAAVEESQKAGFNPNQPRVPRGNPDGGEWTDEGGGSGGGTIGGRTGRFGIPKTPRIEDPRLQRVADRESEASHNPRAVAKRLRKPNPEPMAPKHPKRMRATPEAVERIIGKESFEPHPYRVLDNHGKASGNWTIGYGHEIRAGETFPEEGLTREGAEALLDQDIGEAEHSVRNQVKVPLTQLQFDALTSLNYNLGYGNFRDSDLLRRLNKGDYDGAAEAFMDYAYSDDSEGNPEIKPGTPTRRAEEAEQFRQGIVKELENKPIDDF